MSAEAAGVSPWHLPGPSPDLRLPPHGSPVAGPVGKVSPQTSTLSVPQQPQKPFSSAGAWGQHPGLHAGGFVSITCEHLEGTWPKARLRHSDLAPGPGTWAARIQEMVVAAPG